MKNIYYLLTIAVTTIAANVSAQSVTVSGVPKPYTLTAEVMKGLKHVQLDAKAHDEKIHHYSGVLLSDILTKADAIMGDGARKKVLTSYVLISAADNYKIIYALPEIDPALMDKTVLLADQVDGKPLSAAVGPYQVIATGEKKHARWIRQVKDIKLVTVTD